MNNFFFFLASNDVRGNITCTSIYGISKLKHQAKEIAGDIRIEPCLTVIVQ